MLIRGPSGYQHHPEMKTSLDLSPCEMGRSLDCSDNCTFCHLFFSAELSQALTKNSHHDSGDFHHHLTGYVTFHCSVLTFSGYLAVGISSVKRVRGRYLLPTLQSIFSESSPEERSSMVVVVLLADFDASWKQSVVKEIVTTFPSELQQGQLVIIHVPLDFYPPLTGAILLIFNFTFL